MNKAVSRTAASVKNAAAGLAYRMAVSVLKLVVKMVFVRHLSEALYGVSGLFGNVLGLLALADLGVDTAVTFALYRPLAEKNHEQIAAVMAFLKKAYRVIALSVLGLGLILVPFLPSLVKGEGVDHLRLYYLVYLGNMVMEYLFSYRRTLARASQEAWRLAPFQTLFDALIASGQIAVLLLFYKHPWCYFVFLLIQSAGLLAQNLVINRVLDRVYPVLKANAPPLPAQEKQSIFKNIRALLFHKVGSVVVAGTDNLIISAMIDLVLVGHYANYASLIATVTGVVYVITGNATASFGNLLAGKDEEKRLPVFREWMVACSFLYGVCSAFFITLFRPFITLAYGEKFLLSPGVVVLIVAANFYLLGLSSSLDVVKAAAGLYDPDKWAPIVQSVLNLAVSIVLAWRIGLAGVFIGTLVSVMVPLTVKPFVLYRHLFGGKPRRYFLCFLSEAALTAGVAALCWFLCGLLEPENLLLNLLWRLLITLLTAPTLFIAAHCPFAPFRALVQRALGLFRRKDKEVHDA